MQNVYLIIYYQNSLDLRIMTEMMMKQVLEKLN